MRLLVFQHIDCEHPGIFRSYLRDDGIDYTAVELDAGEAIPELSGFDALWVMGGPMDVWEVEAHPWLVAEKAAIKKWIRELRRPYLGLCLGHQLMADALGGACAAMPEPEIGILEVELNNAGGNDPVFGSLPQTQACLQWHSVQVTRVPDDAVILARSDVCENQAMRIGNHAWSMQYHMEIEPDTIDNWAKVPAYYNALVDTLGEPALNDMKRTASQLMPTFMSNSKRLYQNFMQQASR